MRTFLRLALLFIINLSGISWCGVAQHNDSTIYQWDHFVMGSDLSYVNVVEACGGRFKVNGKEQDVYKILKTNGNNLVRVRLWHTPSWQQALGNPAIYSDLKDVIHTMKRARASGMAINLDLHYSDTWTDPDHQDIPQAWKGLSLYVMADSLYQYTLQTLLTLQRIDLVPEMIQVGNENNFGMLWPVGKTESGWQAFATFLKAGIKAVRDFSKTSSIKPQIILHVAQLQDAMPWTDSLLQQGVTDFDVLGLSHYYKWSKVSRFDSVSLIIQNLRQQTHKKVMVVETAFPFTNANADTYSNLFWEDKATAVGFPFTITGQRDYYTQLTQAIIDGGGSGIMVWEPAWITSKLNDGWGIGSSWENNSFFDFSGNLHEGIRFMTHVYSWPKKP